MQQKEEKKSKKFPEVVRKKRKEGRMRESKEKE